MPWVGRASTEWSPDRLATLPDALDPTRMGAFLRPRARARFGPCAELGPIGIDIFRRHGNRCVVRYAATVDPKDGGAPSKWRVIGKVMSLEAGERTYRLMKALWANGFDRDAADRISIPEPLEFIPELAMLLQELVGGDSVRNLLKQAADPAHFRLAGRALAKLHASPLEAGPARTVRDLLQRCHPRHPFLAAACPEHASAVETIVTRSLAIERRLPAFAAVPLHGDFHLGQIHVDAERAWLIDFDAMGSGDPASDLGNLMVFLEDKRRRDPALGPLVEAFEDAYFAAMDRAIAGRVPLYQALTHLRRACKVLRLQGDGWREKIGSMLARGATALDAMED